MKLRALLASLLIAVGCSSAHIEDLPAPTPKVSKPPKKKRSSVKPKASPTGPNGHVRMSWYGYGRATASGQAYRRHALACAGASRFPMLSHLVLRNPANGRTTRILINDRGAFESMGRSLDCTPGVWSALGYRLGAGVVTVEVVA